MIEVRLPLAAFLEHPAALADLPVTAVTLTDREPTHHYPDRDTALDAISAACLAYLHPAAARS